MSLRRKTFIQLLKRVAIYFTLGFATTWLISLVILEIPRRVSSNLVSRSLMFDETPNEETRSFVNVYEYRWFGVFERQYSKKKQAFLQNPNSSIRFWWTWNVPSESFVNHPKAWNSIQSEYDLTQFPTNVSQYSQMRIGWPALCFETDGAINADSDLPDGTFSKVVDGAIVTSVIDQSKYFLGQESLPMILFVWFPYQPIWSGIAINTIVYGLMIAFIGSAMRAYRHSRRMHHGNCPYCNYDLSFDHSHGCSECGWRKEQGTS